MSNSDIGDKEEVMILRDYLAVDRTKLANERTFLAYIRTSLTLIVAGGTGLHFFRHWAMQVLGCSLVLLGAFGFVFGFLNFKKVKSNLAKISKSEYWL